MSLLPKYAAGHIWQPVALVDFCAISNAKIPIIGAAFGVCGGKNRLAVGFSRFYARSATKSWTMDTGEMKGL
jgi:hypothetical protein